MDVASFDQVVESFTSLVDSETTVQVLLATSEAQSNIHRQTEEQRTRVICSFAHSNDAGLLKRAGRLADCCKWPLLMTKSDGTPALSLQRCRDRLCPLCSKIKGQQTASKVQEAVQMMNSVRFFTLTLLSTDKKLAQCCEQLISGFRELRRSKVWKEHVSAGIWTAEIKPGKHEGTWNVHLHMLVDGKYFDQKSLSAAWLKATGDSYVVDVRKVNSVKGAAWYVAKYVAKPGDFTKMSDEEICCYATAVKGRRLFGTFGKLHSMKDLEEETVEVATLGNVCISANKVRSLEAEGFAPALRAVQLLEQCGGYWAASVARTKATDSERVSREQLLELGSCITACFTEIESRHFVAPLESQQSDGSLLVEPAYDQPLLIDITPEIDNSYR